jgi:hypothetical protein
VEAALIVRHAPPLVQFHSDLSGAQRRQAIHASHSECHFFAIAAHKLLEYQDWVRTFGVCSSVDFDEVDQFSKRDIDDLRNMREHVIDYFKGEGCVPDRWRTPDGRHDASSREGTKATPQN